MRLTPAISALACAWGAFAAAAVAAPTADPPDAGSMAPPAAYVDTPAGDRWLGHSTYSRGTVKSRTARALAALRGFDLLGACPPAVAAVPAEQS